MKAERGQCYYHIISNVQHNDYDEDDKNLLDFTIYSSDSSKLIDFKLLNKLQK